MKGMKNGAQIIQKPQSKIPELKKYGLLIVFSFFTSITVQRSIGLESLVGSFLVACLLLSILYRDILRYKPQYMKKYDMLVLLGLMIIATILLGRISASVLLNFTRGFGSLSGEGAVFGMPIAAGAMLVTLLFDFHTAIFFSFIVSLLFGLSLQDALYPVYAFVVSLTAAFSVVRCKKRSAILRGGFFVGGAGIVTSIILLLFQSQLLTEKALSMLIFAASTALSVPAIVSLLLPFLEYTFNVTTDISLLELLDLNQPLMKSLMISAPGTYHHSVIVGNLVESAAEAVGVNPLLARVSSYYHDIGKITMPEYFVENYSTAVSKHDKLTAHMSSMIIGSHVKEGTELAVRQKLPQSIVDIIQQHHGTSLMTYFYQKAKDQVSGDHPSEDEYRYPGPKPQTRVAALVMMADAVEAASRVLTDPTPARIAALVDKIINHIFLEGQLDECELTLKDISEIKNHFSYILTGILHKRIDYPGFDFNEQPKKTGKENERGGPGEHEGPHRESPKAGKNPSQENRKGLTDTTQVIRP
ncbi:MAG TPA: HDIG domain-containing protein [Thermodesulfovibrionales bacterium]|nr:HDIG domain-containing protein [Thermodesulfovibrionales bacterium]